MFLIVFIAQMSTLSPYLYVQHIGLKDVKSILYFHIPNREPMNQMNELNKMHPHCKLMYPRGE